jgi:uncharacterized protein YaaQ
MKLILAILRDVDADPATSALLDADLRVTRIASTGGWLRRGVTTLMIGVEDAQVEQALNLLKQACSPAAEGEKRATVFVLPVEHFHHI